MAEMSAAMTAYIIFIAALLGLVMGSFMNCFAFRYVNGESVLKGRSKCALCGHTLAALDLIPIFSWLSLKGKCRYCSAKISPKYMLAEIFCGIIYVSVLLRFDLSLQMLKFLVLMSLLFAATFTDIYGRLVPDRIIVGGAVFALAFTLIEGQGAPALLSLLINGLSISLPLLIIVLLFEKVTKKESMGGGDIKLIFMIGLYFDWKLNLLILIIACIVGIVFALFMNRGDNESEGLPFVPSLSIAAFIAMLCGEQFLTWYLGLFL